MHGVGSAESTTHKGMSLFDRVPMVPEPADNDSGDSPQLSLPLRSKASDDAPTNDSEAEVPPTAETLIDARAIVRLVQCSKCSLPYRQPIALRCGRSICRDCLPPTHKREHVTYPFRSGWSEGLMCPFEECGQEHPLGDCGSDVSLAKVLEQVSTEMAKRRPLASDARLQLEERPPTFQGTNEHPGESGGSPRSHILGGGRLVATYTMAELGELRYDADVSYQQILSGGAGSDDAVLQQLDRDTLERLRTLVHGELECLVCWAILLDPVTLSCGHTFCRRCVGRVLDHSQNCPTCRRPLTLTSPTELNIVASNAALAQLLLKLCPEQIAARVAQIAAEEETAAVPESWENREIPLFVCTLAFPRIPTFLHIFEPRYRLMIRRAMESDRQFGMMAYNAAAETQGDLGATQFLRYGTLLYIVNYELLPDGRSLIETVGVSRFTVRSHRMRDGYIVGHVDRVDDIPVDEEAHLEATQVSQAAAVADQSADPEGSPRPLAALSTRELLNIGTDFIRRMRLASAPWLSDSIIQAYGDVPDDPALFPFWFASVLPINESQRYRLLPTRSVRQRLIVCAEWVRAVERTRWFIRLRSAQGSPEAPASSFDSQGSDSSAQPPASSPDCG